MVEGVHGNQEAGGRRACQGGYGGVTSTRSFPWTVAGNWKLEIEIFDASRPERAGERSHLTYLPNEGQGKAK